MPFNKIITATIDKEIKEQLSVNQQGGRDKFGINTVKIATLNNIEKKGYNKILLIDLKKVFDMFDLTMT